MSSSAQQYDRVIGRAWLQEAVEKGTCRYRVALPQPSRAG